MRLFDNGRYVRVWRAQLGSGGRGFHRTMEYPPIEKVARDLRRLRRLLDELPVGASYVRSIGLLRAYDDVLALACEELQVSTEIRQLAEGAGRELERLRVEYLLAEAGMQLR